MKLHEALRKVFFQFGCVVLEDNRMTGLLSRYSVFDEYPELEPVIAAIFDNGYAKELGNCILKEDREAFLLYAEDVKKQLVSKGQFTKELADYAVDSISFGLHVKCCVVEPSCYCLDKKGKTDQCGAEKLKYDTIQQTDVSASSSESYELGEKYYYGFGVSRDYKKALEYFSESAKQGNAGAQYRLGFMYFSGLGGARIDFAQSAYWLRKAAEFGNSAAQYWLGVIYNLPNIGMRNYSEAAKWFKMSAEQGNAGAQYELGLMYESGTGVPRNYEEAVKWYSRAAEQGVLSNAEIKLGRLYENGQGVQQNYEEAAKWYRRAAGNSSAMYRLGSMYEEGIGVERNYEEAVKWYWQAACHGMLEAYDKLGYMYENGLGVEKNNEIADKWYRKAKSSVRKTMDMYKELIV